MSSKSPTVEPRSDEANEQSEESAAETEATVAADAETTETADVVLELADASKEFGRETAVTDLSLAVRDGELLTLLGPSGCGKTTTLRMIAGLETPSAGTITLDGERVADDSHAVDPEDRDVGIVFQDFALFPHMTVAENIAFGLTDATADERERRVTELLELVGLESFGDRTPDQLSGGQKQRVALARALAPEPDLLLLDEPFSNLDVRLRVRMREEVRRILDEAGVTAVSVTHDQEEAMSISDRVAVLNDGRLEQVGRPENVFEQPESRFVAEFLGRAGFLSGRVEETGVHTGIGTFDTATLQGLTEEYTGTDIDVLVRPDDLEAVPVEEREGSGDGDGDAGDGRIVHRQYTGSSFVYRVELDTGDVIHCEHNHTTDIRLDRRVEIAFDADHTLAWYPAE
ncbi:MULTISPECIES: ABC transporter ATP-binding protein [Halococcus]|uniref:Molybdate/tungstate import ATP-binding protein WtpC n=1 Tax=Halococcus salifodinae DSM 8989 TaxID=1227456 RepID=M0N173_9EURY|nr:MULTISPECIES: ABC transporter ATP-binding protein [Halococcus]EMA50430.1 iron ABC transporter ATP-binding protein [Halococcus salifodinae DSM 8989]